MAKIILFWCFENINFLGRIMEFQVQFWHPSDLRLWRTGCAIYVQIDCWNSNVQCCWTCLQRKISKIIDPSTPQNHLLLDISMWDTLYFDCATDKTKVWGHANLDVVSRKIWQKEKKTLILTHQMKILNHLSKYHLKNTEKWVQDLRNTKVWLLQVHIFHTT